jgi:hypothetical protein
MQIKYTVVIGEKRSKKGEIEPAGLNAERSDAIQRLYCRQMGYLRELQQTKNPTDSRIE